MSDKRPSNPEYKRFTKVMDGLMAVPYKELQKKLAEEKRQKAKKKRATLPPHRKVRLS
jgi:hypothetical protein